MRRRRSRRRTPRPSTRVAGHVRGLTADALLVVVVKDVHWSDTLTRDLLGYLAGVLDGARLLLVLTSRPEVPDAVDGFLAELLRLPSTEAIDLSRLGRSEVVLLAAQLTADEARRSSPELLSEIPCLSWV